MCVLRELPFLHVCYGCQSLFFFGVGFNIHPVLNITKQSNLRLSHRQMDTLSSVAIMMSHIECWKWILTSKRIAECARSHRSVCTGGDGAGGRRLFRSPALSDGVNASRLCHGVMIRRNTVLPVTEHLDDWDMLLRTSTSVDDDLRKTGVGVLQRRRTFASSHTA